MDLWTVVKVVVRRWYAVLPVLVLTGAFAYQIDKAPPTYEANASVLLVAPNSTTGATGATVKQNSFLIFSGSLNITASAVSRILNDSEVRASYAEAGLLPDFEIGSDPSIPLIGVTATGSDGKVVVATVKRVLTDVSAQLQTLQDQAEAPADARIGVRELVNPDTADSLRGDVGRTMATVGALGLLLAAAVALTIEGLVTRRRPGQRLATTPAVPVTSVATPVRPAVPIETVRPASTASAPPVPAPAPAAPAHPTPTEFPAPVAPAAYQAPAVYQAPPPAPAPVPAPRAVPATPAYEQPAVASAASTAASAPAYPRSIPTTAASRVEHPVHDRHRSLGAVAEQRAVEPDVEELPAPVPLRRTDERPAHPGLTSIDGGGESSPSERRVHPFLAAQRLALKPEHDG